MFIRKGATPYPLKNREQIQVRLRSCSFTQTFRYIYWFKKLRGNDPLPKTHFAQVRKLILVFTSTTFQPTPGRNEKMILGLDHLLIKNSDLDQAIPCYSIRYIKALITQLNQVVIAQWLAWQLATGEVLCSNPSKGDNLLISD